MAPIYEPAQLTHPRLQEFAIMAAFLATVEETAEDLEDLLINLPPDAPLLPDFRTPWPWEFDFIAVALSIVRVHREDVTQSMEELLTAWLGEDRENGPVLRLTLIDPWQERPGIWSEDTPEWIRTFATIAETAHAKHGPFDRRSPSADV